MAWGAAYHAALGAVDPTLRLGRVAGPVLVVRGETDLVTTPEDAVRLDRALAARPTGTHRVVTVPETGHLLAHAADLEDARRVLRRGELFFNPAVLDSVASWITGHPVRRAGRGGSHPLGAERASPSGQSIREK